MLKLNCLSLQNIFILLTIKTLLHSIYLSLRQRCTAVSRVYYLNKKLSCCGFYAFDALETAR